MKDHCHAKSAGSAVICCNTVVEHATAVEIDVEIVVKCAGALKLSIDA